MRLLTLQLISYLHAILNSRRLNTLDHQMLLEGNAVKYLQSTASAHPLVFSSLFFEGVQALHIKQPAVERGRLIEMDDGVNAVRTYRHLLESGFL